MRTTTKIKSILKYCTIELKMEDDVIDFYVVNKNEISVYSGKVLSNLVDKAYRGTKRKLNNDDTSK